MGKLVVLDKEKDIKGIMVTGENGELIAVKGFKIPENCIVLFVDKDTWEVQSK